MLSRNRRKTKQTQKKTNNICLKDFIKNAWNYIDGAVFVDNWHIDAIAEHLEALFSRDIRKLLICIPPRMAKSQICSVCFPTWVWLKDPSTQIYTASYSTELCIRDSWKSRLLINTPWYKNLSNGIFKLSEDSNRKNRYDNDKNGYRLALSTNSSSTGHGYDLLIIDDPHKATDVHSRAKRESVLKWYSDAMSTRANNPDTAIQIVIGQRLHENDLIGFLQESGEWELLKLPMEYVPTTHITSIGWKDPRTIPGELLFPARYNKDAVERLKKDLRTPYNISAQLQQNPIPEEGLLIAEADFSYFDFRPRDIEKAVISWDTNLGKEIKDSLDYSYTCGVVILESNEKYYIDYVVRTQEDFHKQLQIVSNVIHKFKNIINVHLLENKSSSFALESMLKKAFPDIKFILINPKEIGGDKISRLNLCLDLFKDKKIYIPSENYVTINTNWVEDFKKELLRFPYGANDDQVDALTQGLIWLRMNKTNGIIPANSQIDLYDIYKDSFNEDVKKIKEFKEDLTFKKISTRSEIRSLWEDI